MLIPPNRQWFHNLLEHHVGVVPAIEDCGHDARCKQAQAHHPAGIGLIDALGLGELGNRCVFVASIIRRQRWARASAFSRALSILGCGGAGVASESMVLRPPRIVNVIGTCTVIVGWSMAANAFMPRPFFALKPRASPGSDRLAPSVRSVMATPFSERVNAVDEQLNDPGLFGWEQLRPQGIEAAQLIADLMFGQAP